MLRSELSVVVALGAAVLFAQWWRRRRRAAAAPTLLSLGADKAAAAAAAAADAGAGAEPSSTRTELSSPRSAAGHAGNIESDGFFFKLEVANRNSRAMNSFRYSKRYRLMTDATVPRNRRL